MTVRRRAEGILRHSPPAKKRKCRTPPSLLARPFPGLPRCGHRRRLSVHCVVAGLQYL